MTVCYDRPTDGQHAAAARWFTLAALAEAVPVADVSGASADRLAPAALLDYARSPSFSPALEAALLRDPARQALYRGMVERWLDAENAAMAPLAAAAASGPLSVRNGPKFRLELLRDTAEDGQTCVAIFLAPGFGPPPTVLVALGEDGSVVKEGPLPAPYDDAIQLLAEEDSPLVRGLRAGAPIALR